MCHVLCVSKNVNYLIAELAVSDYRRTGGVRLGHTPRTTNNRVISPPGVCMLMNIAAMSVLARRYPVSLA